jgi:hypothetical protein
MCAISALYDLISWLVAHTYALCLFLMILKWIARNICSYTKSIDFRYNTNSEIKSNKYELVKYKTLSHLKPQKSYYMQNHMDISFLRTYIYFLETKSNQWYNMKGEAFPNHAFFLDKHSNLLRNITKRHKRTFFDQILNMLFLL